MAHCVKGVDVLYHESTYLEALQTQAAERGHATPREAAQVAELAQVKHLILGHYSSRYKKLVPFLEEAKAVFENSHLAREGHCFDLGKMIDNRDGGVESWGLGVGS